MLMGYRVFGFADAGLLVSLLAQPLHVLFEPRVSSLVEPVVRAGTFDIGLILCRLRRAR
jgi:hypothetical protein